MHLVFACVFFPLQSEPLRKENFVESCYFESVLLRRITSNIKSQRSKSPYKTTQQHTARGFTRVQ